MRVRVKRRHVLFGYNFRRVGHSFTQEWTDVDPSMLTPAQVDLLTSAESARYLEIEGAPTIAPPQVKAGTPDEAIAAALAAGESLPGGPSAGEVEAATKKGRGK